MSDDAQFLRNFFTDEQPLGRIEAVEHISDTDRTLFRTYFHQSNRPYRQITRQPTMIVGRRGSGKTDALLAHEFIPELAALYNPLIYFEAADAANLFHNILYAIDEQVRSDRPKPMVESVAALWTRIFWTVMIHRIVNSRQRDSSDHDLLVRFVEGQKIDLQESNPYKTAYQALISLVEQFKALNETTKSFGFFSQVEQLTSDSITYAKAKEIAINLLKAKTQRGIILLDSFENLDVTHEESKLTLSGLLRSVSRFHDEHIPVDIRCCIPAEAYFYVTEISSNILKDFERQTILHWSAMEILQLSAKRYAEFIRLHHQQAYSELVEPHDFKSRTDTLAFWSRLLPDTVPNSNATIREETVPYLLRHTQLLPRHVILLLNRCFSNHFSRGGKVTDQIDDRLVTTVVRNTEGQIADQIISAYQFIWPLAREQITAVFKELNHNIVSVGHLHRVFNRAGVRGSGNIHEFSDFVRMLTELGAIGRLIQRTDRYAVAAYEYSEPFRLLFNTDDELCIHPCFTEVFRVISLGHFPADYSPVYPLGANPSDPDRRPLFD